MKKTPAINDPLPSMPSLLIHDLPVWVSSEYSSVTSESVVGTENQGRDSMSHFLSILS